MFGSPIQQYARDAFVTSRCWRFCLFDVNRCSQRSCQHCWLRNHRADGLVHLASKKALEFRQDASFGEFDIRSRNRVNFCSTFSVIKFRLHHFGYGGALDQQTVGADLGFSTRVIQLEVIAFQELIVLEDSVVSLWQAMN